MPEEGPTSNRPDPASKRLDREESQLWRWALGLLVLLAAAVAALSWEQLKDLPYRLWAIPAGLFADFVGVIASVLACRLLFR